MNALGLAQEGKELQIKDEAMFIVLIVHQFQLINETAQQGQACLVLFKYIFKNFWNNFSNLTNFNTLRQAQLLAIGQRDTLKDELETLLICVAISFQ